MKGHVIALPDPKACGCFDRLYDNVAKRIAVDGRLLPALRSHPAAQGPTGNRAGPVWLQLYFHFYR